MPALTIPNVFSPNTTAVSSEVNANFNAVSTLLNSTKLDSTNLQAAAVATATLADNSVTGAKLNSNVVDNSTLQYATSVLSLKDGGITTAKLVDASVTQAKRAALGQQVSSGSSSYTTTSAVLVAVTNLSITITTTGRPIFLGLVHDGSANEAQFGYTGAGGGMSFQFYDNTNTTAVAKFNPAGTGATQAIMTAPWHVFVPVAGTYNYTFRVVASGATVYCSYMKLIAYEL